LVTGPTLDGTDAVQDSRMVPATKDAPDLTERQASLMHLIHGLLTRPGDATMPTVTLQIARTNPVLRRDTLNDFL